MSQGFTRAFKNRLVALILQVPVRVNNTTKLVLLNGKLINCGDSVDKALEHMSNCQV